MARFQRTKNFWSMADLLYGPIVPFNGPGLPVGMQDLAMGGFHPLFFAGRIVHTCLSLATPVRVWPFSGDVSKQFRHVLEEPLG